MNPLTPITHIMPLWARDLADQSEWSLTRLMGLRQ